jgi:excinuclease UvrABC nuclease subunit
VTNALVPQVVAMQITGHKTTSMYRRYSITEKDDVAQALERVARREVRREERRGVLRRVS